MSPRPGTPTPPADGSSRRIVGRYRLDSELGRGAMGTVWSAYDEVLHRPVAVKEVRLSLVPVQERAIVRERTLREARSTAMLSHPNVVTLYDVVEVDSAPYVVMELLPSRSLAAYIGERGRLTQTEAAEIGSAVASALTTAHRAGITHRDVKPGNVLIGEDGQIKLTDFGIARNAAEQSMTQTGTVLGSPPYIAPEVAMGRAVGPAADLWGLGATLFACLEGRPPYDGGDPVATVSAVVHGDIPMPSSAGPVTDVIRGLMVKDPAQRMPLAAVRRRLRPLLSDPEGPVLSPPTPATGVIKVPPQEQSGSDRAGLIPLVPPDRSAPPAPSARPPRPAPGPPSPRPAPGPPPARPTPPATGSPGTPGVPDTDAGGSDADALDAPDVPGAGPTALEPPDDDRPDGNADEADKADDVENAPEVPDAPDASAGRAEAADASADEADHEDAEPDDASEPDDARDQDADDGQDAPADADRPDADSSAGENADVEDSDDEPVGESDDGTDIDGPDEDRASDDGDADGDASDQDDSHGADSGGDDSDGNATGSKAAGAAGLAGVAGAAAGAAAVARAATARSVSSAKDTAKDSAAIPAPDGSGDENVVGGSRPGDRTVVGGSRPDDQTVVGDQDDADQTTRTRVDHPRRQPPVAPPAATTTRVPPRAPEEPRVPDEDRTRRVPRPAPRPGGAAAPTPATGSPTPGRWTPPPGTPRPAGPPPPRPPQQWGPSGGPGAPLAADPGPLPFTPSAPRTSPTRRRLTTAAVLVLVVVLALAGALGAYALTRAIAGQPPLSLSLQPGGQVVAGARLIDHDDSDARYSGTGMKFSSLVPAGWQQYRLQQPTDDIVVRFVSPDADRELRVDRVVGYYPARRAGDYVGLLADPARVGADRSVVEPLTTVGTPRPGAREAAQQTVYRTTSGPSDDRTTWARLVPAGADLWVVRLTSGSATAAGAPEQFAAIADSFTPRAP